MLARVTTQMVTVGLAIFSVTYFPGRVSAEIDAATVQQSIDRGIAYLRGTQTQRGNWPEFGNQSCGLSALCTLSLLTAGVPANDPAMVRALAYLRSFEPQETYSVALQTLVFCQVGAAGDLPKIRRNVQWLAKYQKPADDRRSGAWDYGNGTGSGDPSNAQFAILAIGAAVDRGIEVEPKVLTLATEYWKRQQLSRGGWSYGGLEASGSMTCAGIASLMIARSAMKSAITENLQCCGPVDGDEAIDRGLSYLGKIFSLRENPGGELLSYYYYMYAVERVGRLSGQRLIGGRDWYREGAEQLVERQDQFQGFWQGGGVVESNRDIATSFALLFLSKGKRQVVIGRLSHPSLTSSGVQVGDVRVVRNQPIDQQASSPVHSTALRQLVRHVERDWSRDLTWQNIDAETATVSDLLQTPVLVIAGSGTLRFNDQLQNELKEYIDQGGTILFDAQSGDGCGVATEFERSVTELCKRWFPESRLEKLPMSHPVWFAERPVDPKSVGSDFWVYGLGACCRTPIFYSSNSLVCRWSYGDLIWSKSKLPEALVSKIASGIAIGENLIAYATGRELKDKLEAAQLLDGREAPTPSRGAIPIATGALGAGEDQAMRVLPHASSLIRERLSVEVIAVDEPIELTEKSLARVGALYLHGQTSFELTPEARQALRIYLQRNGLLIASPICGNEAFADSFRRELALILPDSKLEPVPPEHPAFSTRYGGYDLSGVTIRSPGQRAGGAVTRGDGEILPDGIEAGQPTSVTKAGPLQFSQRRGTPRIEVARLDNREVVFFSPLDLSCALESQNSIQCPGYPTADAAKIIAGLLLYGLQQ